MSSDLTSLILYIYNTVGSASNVKTKQQIIEETKENYNAKGDGEILWQTQ